ncbi:PaaI family thioesterase [Candidatus Desulfarcum epimagneticum]|uniref:Medium/long-chain acyl-CoA thioesterase YigI n=1 Tax=uncultured Desulfobacteraceae bacterium TaxID=218296 RepID=A0A484HLK6_9BACT|nr:PaaI family thioesterase [uncultured Desulfobacteraceae bacterium]
MDFKPLDPNYEARVRKSFERQRFMSFIGAKLVSVTPGGCEIYLPYKEELSQQHGYFHAGVVGTIADNCGGYAAYSLMPAGSSILTVEYKLNLVAPGLGQGLIGRGKVIRPGRSLTVCETRVFGALDGAETLCATSLMTLMNMEGKPDRRLDEKI